jgi:hypothetical protein
MTTQQKTWKIYQELVAAGWPANYETERVAYLRAIEGNY